MKKRQTLEIQNYILNLCLAVFSLLLVLVLLPMFWGSLHEEYKDTLYGFRPYIVKTDSMDPTIRPGALVIGRVVPFEKIEEDNIITFVALIEGAENFNTHRVIKKDAAYLTTKGDNPLVVPDALPVTRSNFRYKVVVIWNGAAAWNTPKGMVLYLLLPGLGLLLLAGGVAAVCIAAKRKKRSLPSEEELPPPPVPEQPQPAPVQAPQPVHQAPPQPPTSASTQRSDIAAPQVLPQEDEEDELLLQATLLVAQVERQRKAAEKAKKSQETESQKPAQDAGNTDKEDLEWIENYLKQKDISL